MTMVLTGTPPLTLAVAVKNDVVIAATNLPLNQGQLSDNQIVENSGYRVVSATHWESVTCYLLVKDSVKNLT